MGASPSDVTIVVVTYNSAGVIANALESLPPESRVICVDNGSSDDTLSLLARYPVEIVQNGENAGYGLACNRGAELARSEFLLMMNPDVVLMPDAVTELLAASERYPDGSVYLPFVEDADGDIVFRDQSRIEAWAPEIPPRPRIAPAGDCCTRFAEGSVFMIRREAFNRVGGFDPAIFLYYEDDDLSFRLVKDGDPIIFVRDARARHLISQSSPATTLAELASRTAEKKISEYYVRAKHGMPRARSVDAAAQVGRMVGGACRLDFRAVVESYGRLRAVLGLVR